MKRATVLFAAVLAGCGTAAFDSAKVDYKSAAKQTLPPLEIPPDLTTPARDDRFQLPDTAPASGATTLSAYTAERKAGGPKTGTTQILPDVANVKIERAGNERWLVVPESPEKVWPVVKEFWQENGLLIKTEIPEAGIMETDWAENRAKVDAGLDRNFLSSVIGTMYSTGYRDKFRTRLERGPNNTTEIYISHRGVEEVYANQNRDSTVWQARPSDPGLEAEFLRKLMVRFGVDDVRARAQLAEKPKEEHAKIVNAQDGVGTLQLDDPFDRAWRRVGLALDRVGFTVEDRDRSNGYYFVRYVDPEADAQDKKNDGVLSKLAFWRSSTPDNKAAQYRVAVKDHKDSSEVQVLGKDGTPDRTDTARKILSLLQEQLK